MSAMSAQFPLASLSANWTTIILIAIFALGLVVVVLTPMTFDVINAHKSWRAIVIASPDAIKVLDGPRGMRGLARATMALGLLVAIGFGLAYVLVEHPFKNNETVITAILSALTTAFASVTAFYFSTRAMEGASKPQPPAGPGPPGNGNGSTAPQPLTVTIAVPKDGAVFKVDDSVNADYSVAPSPGAQITALKGTVENGSPIDTTSAGSFSFVVTAKDSAGQESEVTSTYTVIPPQ
jgi:hypothetical protein